jgi:hypothetical protein
MFALIVFSVAPAHKRDAEIAGGFFFRERCEFLSRSEAGRDRRLFPVATRRAPPTSAAVGSWLGSKAMHSARRNWNALSAFAAAVTDRDPFASSFKALALFRRNTHAIFADIACPLAISPS